MRAPTIALKKNRGLTHITGTILARSSPIPRQTMKKMKSSAQLSLLHNKNFPLIRILSKKQILKNQIHYSRFPLWLIQVRSLPAHFAWASLIVRMRLSFNEILYLNWILPPTSWKEAGQRGEVELDQRGGPCWILQTSIGPQAEI